MSTPLRRSDAGSSRTPKTPSCPAVNNDEEERKRARKSFIDTSNTLSSVDQCENFDLGLQMFRENKFTKENAWSINLITSFADLIKKHHQAVGNFQTAGFGLEASAKLWGLRVDSTHEKSVRLLSGLGSKKTARGQNDNADDTVAEEEGPAGPTAKPKRKKRPKSTVTKNVDTINAKLETNPMPEPIMAQLRSIFGDIANPNRLLCNKLVDRNGKFNLDSHAPLHLEKEAVKLDPKKEADWSQSKWFTIEVEDLKPTDRLRPMHSHYEITDTPAEDDEEAAWDPQQLTNANNELSLAFDVNAEVEPIPECDDNYDACEPDFPDVGDMTEEDRAAIMACKTIRPKSMHIQDLRPTEAHHSRLEYSYRPMEMINQYWAGPSHWRFKRPSKTSLASTEGRTSGAMPKQKRSRRIRPSQMRVDEFSATSDGKFFGIEDAKLRHQNIRRKWEQKEKLKLPTDYKFDREMFNKYKFAPGVKVREANSDAPQELPINDDYNYDNPVDRSYCSNVMAQDDTDTETGTEVGGEPVEPIVGEEVAGNATIGHFDMEYEGAPEKVEKIVLPYSKRAKVVDMKQLKKASRHLVDVGCKSSNVISFRKLYAALPQLLSPMMRENLTVPLAFYAVLHLANECGLEVIPGNEKLEDFGIKREKNVLPVATQNLDDDEVN